MVRTTLGTAALAAAMMTLSGCTASHGQAPDGEACGPTVCETGTFCCNESCGICIAPGGSCHHRGCAPVADAGPPIIDDGGITCGFETCGVGSHCCSGCTAAESYCAPLDEPCPRPGCFPDAGTARACEGVAGVDCGPDEFCDHSGICGPGEGGGTGTCQPRPDGCPEPTCRYVCGCDGNTYCNECEANAAGTTVASEGACGEPGECEPMDARGEGLCFQVLGHAWNGAECVSITGCSCEGADCDALFSSREACLEAYSGCATEPDCRTEGCPDGSSCQLCWTDFTCLPDGAVC